MNEEIKIYPPNGWNAEPITFLHTKDDEFRNAETDEPVWLSPSHSVDELLARHDISDWEFREGIYKAILFAYVLGERRGKNKGRAELQKEICRLLGITR